jgi:hypothetical protein
MGKITSQTIEAESIQESKPDFGSKELSSETPMGYDEEIGLWEELEHRFRRNIVSKPSANEGYAKISNR